MHFVRKRVKHQGEHISTVEFANVMLRALKYATRKRRRSDKPIASELFAWAVSEDVQKLKIFAPTQP